MKVTEGYVRRYTPDTPEAAIAYLRGSERVHLEAVEQAIRADEGRIFPADQVMLGVAQRSLMLIAGFTALVEQSNAVCAVPLLRLQLDNIMRFYALWLVRDPMEVLKALLSETPFSKLKSHIDKKPLTDAYLAAQLSKHHPWVSDVYKRTSGFIHLSMPGILSSVAEIGDTTDRTLGIRIGSNAGRPWRSDEKMEAVDAFIAATEALLHLFCSWVVSKEQGATRRATKR